MTLLKMENISQEQIKELNSILSLPPEQQEPRLSAFLETLSDGQIEYLKSLQQQQGGASQGQSCIFCSLADGKVPTNVIYQDEKIFACLDRNPGNPGHFIVFTRQHIENSFYMEDDIFSYLLLSSNKLLRKMIEVVQASSGNILLSNGQEAGQRVDHFIVHCIPRFKDDTVNLTWKPKALENTESIVESFNGLMLYKKKMLEPKTTDSKKLHYDDFRIP